MIGPLVILHSLSNIIESTNRVLESAAPDIEAIHLLDETIWLELFQSGAVGNTVIQRTCLYAVIAEQANAGAMLTTCSSLSPCFEIAQQCVGIPLIRLDVPAVTKAVGMGRSVGLVTTARTTVQPYIELVRQIAEKEGRRTEAVDLFCDGALAALRANEIVTHDEIVLNTIHDRVEKDGPEVIILCQASLHRLQHRVENTISVPVLSVLPMAIERALEILKD